MTFSHGIGGRDPLPVRYTIYEPDFFGELKFYADCSTESRAKLVNAPDLPFGHIEWWASQDPCISGRHIWPPKLQSNSEAFRVGVAMGPKLFCTLYSVEGSLHVHFEEDLLLTGDQREDREVHGAVLGFLEAIGDDLEVKWRWSEMGNLTGTAVTPATFDEYIEKLRSVVVCA